MKFIFLTCIKSPKNSLRLEIGFHNNLTSIFRYLQLKRISENSENHSEVRIEDPVKRL